MRLRGSGPLRSHRPDGLGKIEPYRCPDVRALRKRLPLREPQPGASRHQPGEARGESAIRLLGRRAQVRSRPNRAKNERRRHHSRSAARIGRTGTCSFGAARDFSRPSFFETSGTRLVSSRSIGGTRARPGTDFVSGFARSTRCSIRRCEGYTLEETPVGISLSRGRRANLAP